MTDKQPTYVKIRPKYVEYAFHVYFKEEGKFTIGYIPAYDIVFTSNSREEATSRAKNKAFAFMKQFDGNANGLMEALSKLGFKSNEPATNSLQIKKGLGSRGKLVKMDNNLDQEFEFETSEFITSTAA